MLELAPIANSPRSSAFGVNTTGVAVGASYTQVARATLWQPDRTVTDLTSRISATGLSGTEAMAINDAGWIVGSSTRADGSVRLVLWRPNGAPTVDAGGPYTAKNKHTVFTFDTSGSSDPDGDALTYEWDFGHGSAVATGATVQHEYGEKGEFTVTLTIRDAFGATTVTTIPVIVGNPKKQG